MTTVQRAQGFPILAAVVGALGSVMVALGALGRFAPEAAAFAPALRERLVCEALLVSGGVFIAIELIVLLAWIRRRRQRSRWAWQVMQEAPRGRHEA